MGGQKGKVVFVEGDIFRVSKVPPENSQPVTAFHMKAGLTEPEMFLG